MPAGKPTGHELLDAGVSLTEKLVSISPASGSVGGTTIVANVPGAGVDSSEHTLWIAGVDICETKWVSSYGVLNCKTSKTEILSGDVFLYDTVGQVESACASSCTYEQLAASASPSTTSVSSTETTIVFSGANFQTSAHTVRASLAGIAADSVVVDSTGQVTATWANGVPLSGEAAAPELFFEDDSTGVILQSVEDAAAVLTNAISVTASSSSSGMECSFAGGCDLEISALGLTQMISSDPHNNRIDVCGRPCELSDTADASVARCKLPALPTTFSDQNFGIQTNAKLTEFEVTSTGEQWEKMFDDNLYNFNDDGTGDCHTTMTFKTGHLATLTKMRVYLPGNLAKSLYIDKLSFEGSNDGVSFDNLYTVDNNAHTGWNYQEWPENMPAYNVYRFKGSSSGACKIGEVELFGIESMNDEQSMTTCQASIHLGGVDTPVAGDIMYAGALTPVLDLITPRMGSVVGGDEVVFTGEGFSATAADYNIVIDGVVCVATAATTTSVTCTTGSRPGLRESTLVIEIAGKGRVSTQGKLYIYANAWSSTTTWGGEFPPLEGESIYVPKGLNLLMDVDSTPLLMAIIVEGSLLIQPDADPMHERTLDAKYIFVNLGKLEVGTEEFPYTSKITITMHSSVDDPYLPIYGNKVIGVRFGTLDMHGITRVPTWTSMETTAEAGENTITLQEAVDWVAGEEISIASSDYESRHAEKRTIVSVDNSNPDKPVLTLDAPLEW